VTRLLTAANCKPIPPISYGWSEAREFQDRPSPTSRQQQVRARCLCRHEFDSVQPKAADAPSPLIHTRFMGMELDAALKTQINLALANALLGVKSADVSADAIGELVTAGVSFASARHNRKSLNKYAVSSTAAPVIRQQVSLTQPFIPRFQFTFLTHVSAVSLPPGVGDRVNVASRYPPLMPHAKPFDLSIIFA
jgi:hypothetical protein